jgi:hypothetical protein
LTVGEVATVSDPVALVNDLADTPARYPSATTATVQPPPEIALEQDILDRFAVELHRCGVVGEDRLAKLGFLCLTSRLLDEPVSAAVKGVSSSGKSKTLETTMRFFPESAYIAMTAMSEKALIYMREEFAHRTLVLFEAVALREQREKVESNQTAYFIRSLLSEGHIKYPVTQKDKDGNFITRTITKKGPTNLIVTTTSISLHGENETRLLSIPTNDTPEQTRAIMRQLAAGTTYNVDFTPWHELQIWLEATDHRVVIPFAAALAEIVPPVAVRLRRDFRAILRLIETHAILHQATRERGDDGRIIATEADYVAVRGLVADLVSEGVGATVSDTMRETVGAVEALASQGAAKVKDVAEYLHLDKSAASRRLKAARERGFVENEEGPGRPARYVVGDPMPDAIELLPETLDLASDVPAGQGGGCTVASPAEGRGDTTSGETCPSCGALAAYPGYRGHANGCPRFNGGPA